MTEASPRAPRDQVDDYKFCGFTVAQAFDVAGLRWLGPRPATWEDLEHEIRETIHEEVRPR